MMSAEDALNRLKEGNARYAAGLSDHMDLVNPVRRENLVGGQEPFAVILGCADSRVPAETSETLATGPPSTGTRLRAPSPSSGTGPTRTSGVGTRVPPLKGNESWANPVTSQASAAGRPPVISRLPGLPAANRPVPAS